PRTRLCSGSSQLVTQVVSTQTRQTAPIRMSVCARVSASWCSIRECEIWVTAKTKTRSKNNSTKVTRWAASPSSGRSSPPRDFVEPLIVTNPGLCPESVRRRLEPAGDGFGRVAADGDDAVVPVDVDDPGDKVA